MVGNEEIFSCSRKSGSKNGERVRFHPVNSDWGEEVQRKTMKWVMSSSKAKADWYRRGNDRVRVLWGLFSSTWTRERTK